MKTTNQTRDARIEEMKKERDEARKIAEHWRDVAAGPFAGSGSLPWETAKSTTNANTGDSAEHARCLEQQRDEARMLCRWAFPILRSMCHDFDNTDTGWECFEKMDSHPEIFSDSSSQ